MGETRIWRSRPRPRLLYWVSWDRDRDRYFYFRSCGIETETKTFQWSLTRPWLFREQTFYVSQVPRPVPRLEKSQFRDRDRSFILLKTINFDDIIIKTKSETFNLGLMISRPRPRLSFWVSWNRDRDRDFWMKSRETETFSRPDILGLTGTETSTETRKVSVPRVSAPRPPISVSNLPVLTLKSNST